MKQKTCPDFVIGFQAWKFRFLQISDRTRFTLFVACSSDDTDLSSLYCICFHQKISPITKAIILTMENSALSLDLEIPFSTAREAEIAFGTLSVDQEPKRGHTKKTMCVKDTVLHVHFESQETKSLRVGLNSFFDHLNLVVKTMEQFGPPVEKQPDP